MDACNDMEAVSPGADKMVEKAANGIGNEMNDSLEVKELTNSKLSTEIESKVKMPDQTSSAKAKPVLNGKNKQKTVLQTASIIKTRKRFKKEYEGSALPPSSPSGNGESPKKRKKDNTFEPPKLKGDTDIFCWRCHKDGSSTVGCRICPRVFHTRCARLDAQPPADWICHECSTVLRAENTETRSEALRSLSVEQFSKLLRFVIQRMRYHEGSTHFDSPVDLEEYPQYRDFVIKPMDLTTLERNIKNLMYGSTEAFLADTKWLVHNSIIFNSVHSDLTTFARALVKIAKQETEEIENCPDCYRHAHTLKEDLWFIEPCRRPHVLIWAKLKGFPHWPGKVMRSVGNTVDVRFFGDHNRSWVATEFCFLYSKEIPASAKNRKLHNLDSCIQEVEDHIKKLKAKYGRFSYFPFRTVYNPKRHRELLSDMLPDFNEIAAMSEANDPLVDDFAGGLRKIEMIIGTTVSSMAKDFNLNNISPPKVGPSPTVKKKKVEGNKTPEKMCDTHHHRNLKISGKPRLSGAGVEVKKQIKQRDATKKTKKDFESEDDRKVMRTGNNADKIGNTPDLTTQEETRLGSVMGNDLGKALGEVRSGITPTSSEAEKKERNNCGDNRRLNMEGSCSPLGREPRVVLCKLNEETISDYTKARELPKRRLSRESVARIFGVDEAQVPHMPCDNEIKKEVEEEEVIDMKEVILSMSGVTAEVDMVAEVEESCESKMLAAGGVLGSCESDTTAAKGVEESCGSETLGETRVEVSDESQTMAVAEVEGPYVSQTAEEVNDAHEGHSIAIAEVEHSHESVTPELHPESVEGSSPVLRQHLIKKRKAPSYRATFKKYSTDCNGKLSVCPSASSSSQSCEETSVAELDDLPLELQITCEESDISEDVESELEHDTAMSGQTTLECGLRGDCPDAGQPPALAPLSAHKTGGQLFSRLSQGTTNRLQNGFPPVSCGDAITAITFDDIPADDWEKEHEEIFNDETCEKDSELTIDDIISAVKETTSKQEIVTVLEERLTHLDFLHRTKLRELHRVTSQKTREKIMHMKLQLREEFERMKRDMEEEAFVSVEKLKRKQWCSLCMAEAKFHCCFGANYCNTSCQEADWPNHMQVCTQYKMRAGDPDVRLSPSYKKLFRTHFRRTQQGEVSPDSAAQDSASIQDLIGSSGSILRPQVASHPSPPPPPLPQLQLCGADEVVASGTNSGGKAGGGCLGVGNPTQQEVLLQLQPQLHRQQQPQTLMAVEQQQQQPQLQLKMESRLKQLMGEQHKSPVAMKGGIFKVPKSPPKKFIRQSTDVNRRMNVKNNIVPESNATNCIILRNGADTNKTASTASRLQDSRSEGCKVAGYKLDPNVGYSVRHTELPQMVSSGPRKVAQSKKQLQQQYLTAPAGIIIASAANHHPVGGAKLMLAVPQVSTASQLVVHSPTTASSIVPSQTPPGGTQLMFQPAPPQPSVPTTSGQLLVVRGGQQQPQPQFLRMDMVANRFRRDHRDSR